MNETDVRTPHKDQRVKRKIKMLLNINNLSTETEVKTKMCSRDTESVFQLLETLLFIVFHVKLTT